MSNSISFQNSLTGGGGGASPPPLPQRRPGFGSFDLNVVMVLSVLLCALICSLSLNAILKCALRCSNLVVSISNANASSFQSGGRLGDHKGVRRNALKKFPTVEYSKEANKLGGIDGECVICLSEFEAGERLRVLPKCYHGFHVHCIDKWLSSHTSCPKCRNSLTDHTCPKISPGCRDSPPTSSSPPPTLAAESVVVNIIAPVEREGLICNYRDMESSSRR